MGECVCVNLVWEKMKDLELFMKWIPETEELHLATSFQTKSKIQVSHLDEGKSKAI